MSEQATPYVGFARKWRPHTFEDLVGQGQVSQGLRSSVEKGRISHAYLFAGPRGVGKTSAARILARSINCEKGPTPSPCGICVACRGIANGSNLDVIEIDGASNNGVEQVRELRDHVNHVPFSCWKKVYIIDEVHMLSAAAFNALLKTLEEPPAYVVFILATTEMERIPETIQSRCQISRFRSITVEDIVDRLGYILDQEGIETAEGEREAILEAIAMSAEGGMRDAQVALDQVASLGEGKLQLETVRDFLGVADPSLLFSLIDRLVANDTPGLLAVVQDMASRGRDMERMAKQIHAVLHDMMILQCGGGSELVRLSEAGLVRARALLQETDRAFLINANHVFMDLEARLKQGGQARGLLEFALIRLTALDGLRPIAELIDRLEKDSARSGGALPPPRGAPASSAATLRDSDSPAGARPRTPAAPGPPPAPSRASSVPLQKGGSLESVDVHDVDRLCAGLMEDVRRLDPGLCRTLESIPLSRIEGRTAVFGAPGQTVNPYDAKRFERPESARTLKESLEKLTGQADFAIRLVGAAPTTASPSRPADRPTPVRETRDGPTATADRPVAASAPRQLTPPVDSGPELDAVPEFPSSADGDEEPEPDWGDRREGMETGIALSPGEARKAFGRQGRSAAQIRKTLESDTELRSKVELVQKIFGATILDGDGNPVRI